MNKELAKEQQVVADHTQIGAKLMGIATLGTLRQKLGLITGTANTEKSGASEITDVELELFRTILSQAKATAATWGGTLYFINLPAWERYGNLQLASKTGARYRDRVLSLVKRLDIPIVDIHPVFQARKDPLSLFSFRRFGHYNEEGHRVVAEEVLRSVAGKN
jgi:hypothetical protein